MWHHAGVDHRFAVSPGVVAVALVAFAACGDTAQTTPITDPKRTAAVSSAGDAESAEKTAPTPEPGQDAKRGAGQFASPATPTPTTTPTTTPADPTEIPVIAWASTTHEAVWTPKPAPSAVVSFEPKVTAGLIGRAGNEWLQLGADGALTPVAFDREPAAAIVGVWPDDAWYIERRDRDYGGGSLSVHELRLMKLREGKRWVPQAVGGEQWWHPGTEDERTPRMSTHTGMLVYPASLETIDRIAGRTEPPVVGPHLGTAVDFVETNRGKVYVLSNHEGAYYAQTECPDQDCTTATARRFPAGSWRFGERVARGKFSVSVLVRNAEATYLLSNVGKDKGWRLDALPSDGEIAGMWASAEGGLWTWNGTVLRWRDTDGAWHDVALPPGVATNSVAISPDRRIVWLSGEANGAAALFTTPAQGPPP